MTIPLLGANSLLVFITVTKILGKYQFKGVKTYFGLWFQSTVTTSDTLEAVMRQKEHGKSIWWRKPLIFVAAMKQRQAKQEFQG